MEKTKPDTVRLVLQHEYTPIGYHRAPDIDSLFDTYDAVLALEITSAGPSPDHNPNKRARIEDRYEAMQAYLDDIDFDGTFYMGTLSPGGSSAIRPHADCVSHVGTFSYTEDMLQSLCERLLEGENASLTPHLTDDKLRQLENIREAVADAEVELATAFSMPYEQNGRIRQHLRRFNGGKGMIAEQYIQQALEGAADGKTVTVIPRVDLLAMRNGYSDSDITMNKYKRLGDLDMVVCAVDEEALTTYFEELRSHDVNLASIM